MSNFGKIKNIWNLDVVSREEMKTTLQEWDDALSSLQTDFNEVKRLTTLKVFTSTRDTINSGYYMGDDSDINGEIDFSRPVYIGFRKFNNSSFTDFSYVVIFHTINYWFFLNENVSVRITNKPVANNKVCIEFNIRNLANTEKIGYPSFRCTPKTLTTTINETQEEGEQWEISK